MSGKDLVDLNVNPCKMCMPMGCVTAFHGIEGCMAILHGSQGCSTYIRRHMATHYNEPIDIASSSLTEEGAVFGGEKNLVKGIDNLIKLYNPKVIGVATTCLAETIGEDIARIVGEYREKRPDLSAEIVTVQSAGYSGTQYEGYFRALRAVLEQTALDPEKTGRVNLIPGPLSPADVRWLKSVMNRSGLDYVLFPDISENLDGEHKVEYKRLPVGGVAMADVRRMAGAGLTIELATFIPAGSSPGEFLRERHGVPLLRLPVPVGLRDTDAFLDAVGRAGGIASPEEAAARGRRLDAMVDSHKYNARARAAVFGEPDFVFSVCRLLAENGSLPLVVATGSKSEVFADSLRREIAEPARFHLADETVVLDDCDFETIEMEAKRLGINILIGSSDARRVSEHTGIPLVRCAFPVHDHVGGQRVRTLGHEGGVQLMDRITNTVLDRIEKGFRKELYDRYYLEGAPAPVAGLAGSRQAAVAANRGKSETHPCFNGCGGRHGRIHLPIAPHCNIQCNYCVRRFDCPNESRPGVASTVLSPRQALERFTAARNLVENLGVVGIAGPGDALANWEETRETLRLIREVHPGVTFCLSTNGLELPARAPELAELGVSHITVTVNAVDPAVGARIYRHVDYMGARFGGETGAAFLLANQMEGIRRAVELGLVCKANIVMLKGINDGHIPEVARRVAGLGCDLSNIMQMVPVKGSEFENTPLVSNVEITAMREKCAPHLKQMMHCRQCRADAVGCLGDDLSALFRQGGATGVPTRTGAALRLAVASKSGVLVDCHFGQATEFYIYEYHNGDLRFRERRGIAGCGSSLCDGNGGGKKESTRKVDKIIDAVSDCHCVLALRIGGSPKEKLSRLGIAVHEAYGTIEDCVSEAVESRFPATSYIN